MEVRQEQFAAEGVTQLKMEIDCADIALETADAEAPIGVTVELDPDADYSSSVNGGTLAIRYRYRGARKHIHMENPPHITLILPEKKKFEEIVLKLGAGSADMGEVELCSSRIKFETGAGRIKTGGLYADESVGMEVGAGDMELGKVRTPKVKAECGVGNFSMNGKIEQELVIECGVGKCDISLEGHETDYNYEVSCGLGKVRVNGNSMNGIAGRKLQNHTDAAGNIRISCGLGKVTLNIA